LILDGDGENNNKKKIDDGVDDNDRVGIDDDDLSGTPKLGVPDHHKRWTKSKMETKNYRGNYQSI